MHAGNMYGGVEAMLLTQVQQRDLCPGLQTSFALCFDGRFSEELIAAGATVHPLGNVRIRQPLSVRRARRILRELLRREAFDVVVSHSCWSQAIFGPTANAASVPLVFYMHSPPNGKHWLERLARKTLPDMVVCNSEFTAKSSPQLYPGVRSETVYGPVAPPELHQAGADRSETRAELQTPEGATVIIQVGRMERLKGHLLHLEALGQLRTLPDWICWQVGGAQRHGEIQYLEELKTHAARLGIADRIRFLNQRSDISRLLAAADIYCQPNTSPESFGVSLIEALYAGLPVITTAFGGPCEIIDESCGVLVPPDDATALAASLRHLIEDRPQRHKLGHSGLIRAHELCSPETQLTKLYEVFQGCAQAHALIQ